MNPRTICLSFLLPLAFTLSACSSSPDYAVLPVETEPKVQKGVVQDFYFPHGESGGDSAMDWVGRVMNVTSGGVGSLLSGNRETAGPTYVIRLSNGRTLHYNGGGDLLMVRGDEVFVHTDRFGRQDVVPAKPRRMFFPR